MEGLEGCAHYVYPIHRYNKAVWLWCAMWLMFPYEKQNLSLFGLQLRTWRTRWGEVGSGTFAKPVGEHRNMYKKTLCTQCTPSWVLRWGPPLEIRMVWGSFSYSALGTIDTSAAEIHWTHVPSSLHYLFLGSEEVDPTRPIRWTFRYKLSELRPLCTLSNFKDSLGDVHRMVFNTATTLEFRSRGNIMDIPQLDVFGPPHNYHYPPLKARERLI